MGKTTSSVSSAAGTPSRRTRAMQATSLEHYEGAELDVDWKAISGVVTLVPVISC